jgi:hypothetical protein
MPLSPRDFSFVAPPTDYRPPNVDFSWLSNLVPDYQKSQLANLEMQQRRLHLQGLQQFLNDYSSPDGGRGPVAGGGFRTEAQPTSDIAAAPITGRSAGAMAGDPRSKIPTIIAAAQKYGVDPSTAIKVARSEGLASFYGDGGKSGGAFQLYTGGGLGNDFRKETGLDPLDPKNEDATIDYAMRKASEGGWGPWNGAKKIGIRGFAGINRGGQQVAAAGDGTATAAVPDTAQQPTGVSTAAPAPEEPVATAPAGPPFAPAAVKAAAPQTNTGPAAIMLASAGPNVGGLIPAPPSQVVPTSSAEVAGTQGQGIGTRPSGIGPGPTPAQNVAARFPGVGQQLAGLIPQPPAPQPATTPAGRDNVPQGSATSTAATTAPSRTPPPAFEKDSVIRDINGQIAQAQAEAARLAKRAALGTAVGMPGGNELVTQKQAEIANLQQQRSERFKALQEEYGRQRATEEEAIRGRSAAEIETGKKEQQDQLKFLQGTAEDGVDARAHIGQLDAIRELGRAAPYGGMTKLKQFLGQYGVETQGLTDIQAYESAINFMAPQLRPPGTGRLMSNELGGFKMALGGLLTTPEGREIAVNNLKLMSEYKIKTGDIARNTDLTPSQRMQKISEVPFPRLQTSAPNAPGAQPSKPQVKAGGKYIWTPQGGLKEQ